MIKHNNYSRSIIRHFRKSGPDFRNCLMIDLGRETDGNNPICVGVRFALCIIKAPRIAHIEQCSGTVVTRFFLFLCYNYSWKDNLEFIDLHIGFICSWRTGPILTCGSGFPFRSYLCPRAHSAIEDQTQANFHKISPLKFFNHWRWAENIFFTGIT